MKPALSLIIAVYKRPDFLEKIFASLCRQTFRDFEVLVADDGSGPDIADTVKKWRKKSSLAVRHAWHEDEGFRKTVIVNAAAAQAQAEYLVFIDGDCVLHHRFLERHHDHKRRGAVLAGRRVMLDEDITNTISVDDIKSGKIEKAPFWWNHCPRDQRKHGIYIPGSFLLENIFGKRYWIVGSNFSVHASDFASVNGYDEAITGRGVEDINLTERFRLKGVRVMTITREALQYHFFHRSDPMPHDIEAYKRFCTPTNFWAEKGLEGHL
ncbi:MAG TPA: glycosyltransferase [Chitinivibrionales bacterium]|nr:glycosyltransferase [Chitinivibrionales bacterium]